MAEISQLNRSEELTTLESLERKVALGLLLTIGVGTPTLLLISYVSNPSPLSRYVTLSSIPVVAAPSLLLFLWLSRRPQVSWFNHRRYS
jgi:hypothetical protein